MAEDKEKRSRINLVTPPDLLENYNYTFSLISPSEATKAQFQNLIENIEFDINVYLYELAQEHDLKWILRVRDKSDIVILDVDNVDTSIRDLMPYLMGHSNVYWLTKGENLVYNTINSNRIYNLDWLYDIIKRRTD